MWSLPRRASLLALVLAAAFSGLQLAQYFLQPVADVDSAGRRQTIVREFGNGETIDQSFLVARDGLHALALSLWSGAPAVVSFDFSLYRRGAGPSEQILSRVVVRSLPAGITRVTTEFPPVTPAMNRVFVVRLHMTQVDPVQSEGSPAKPDVGLVAWADNPLSAGTMAIKGKERWEDLAFAAYASPSTRFQRMVLAIDSVLPSALQVNLVSATALAIAYAVLLLGAIGLAATHLLPAAPPEAGGVDSRTIGRSRLPAVGAAILALGTPALFFGIVSARERVAADLLDDLDHAVLESPMGMHAAFSPITEVINGASPPGLFAHPPSRIAWTVSVPAGHSVLKSSVALRPFIWEDHSDGVAFGISVEEGGRSTPLASRFVNPGGNLQDRAWVEMDVDLTTYAGKSIVIVLTTSPGPAGQSAYDWAMWGDPRIVMN